MNANFPKFPKFPKTSQNINSYHWCEHLLPRFLGGITIITSLILISPWQQSVSGMGEISTLNPENRPQYINAAISGKVSKWFISEGQSVQKGAVLGLMEETQTKFLDPLLIERFDGIKKTLEQQNQSLMMQKQALIIQSSSYKNLLGAVQQGNQAKVNNKQSYSGINQQKIIELEKQSEITFKNLERLRQLHSQGLRSTRDLEVAENEAVKQQATLKSSKLGLQGANLEVNIANFDGLKMMSEGQIKQQENQEKIAKIDQELAKNQAELLKISNEISSLNNRLEQRKIVATNSGIVTKIIANNDFVVKEGEHLILLSPNSNDRIVALDVEGLDVNLIHQNDPVRLQFLGWPSVQVSGWALANFGTFSGRVYNVSPVASDNGKFRVLVVSDEPSDWPNRQSLFIGNQVKGLVLLKTVTVAYELWRRMNGFPAINKMESGDKKVKNQKDTKDSGGKDDEK